MKVIVALCLTALVSIALSACGQKGPLVLPTPQFPPPDQAAETPTRP